MYMHFQIQRMGCFMGRRVPQTRHIHFALITNMYSQVNRRIHLIPIRRPDQLCHRKSE